jgi:predicted dehydrogenase/threonine dehydrogenase-like Zn-dependent dehydrogenase
MKQVLIKQGQVILEEVPVPKVESGTVLVQVDHSCISIGTEMSGIKASGLPLWRRALNQPDNVRKIFYMVTTQGIANTKSLVEEKLMAGVAIGYSAAGVVLEVGAGIHDLQPGDRVACAGAQCAYHAEYIRVPRNLVVPIPDELSFAEASTVTLGAIALQGIRRAQPTLGETFVVIGLGILGQLTVQFLKANGCRVIGTDLDRDRIKVAVELGMDIGIFPEMVNDIDQVAKLTDGIGADGVIITAATPSNEVISIAFKMCRKKGRVVLVGDIGLNLNRADFYQKELDFYISASYGPGRYDNNYEEKGLDYPIGYVRWTENRNMAEYLRLIAEGRIKVAPLIAATYTIEQAKVAYDMLKDQRINPLMVLLSYSRKENASVFPRTVLISAALPASSGRIRIAVIGAGGFAKNIHLPNLKILSDYFHIQTIVSRTGHNAMSTAKKFGASKATTDYEDVLNDRDVDAVLITTRHNFHADMVLKALEANKHVLVEKPLTLTEVELERIMAFYSNTGTSAPPLLLTGFNRRFSPYINKIREITENRSNPMMLNYRMNAGYIPLDHWVHTEEGGGRNIGEACHIYDLFTCLTNSKVISVDARAVLPATKYYSRTDNFVATMTFEDGSVATLTYTALGSKDYSKEQLEVFVDGMVLVMQDYKKLDVIGSKIIGLKSKLMEKGHREELDVFSKAILKGGDWPIPLWQQIQATRIALRVEANIVHHN